MNTSPLVVDLDGTLTPTDTLIESIIKLIKQSPVNLFRIFIWRLKGKVVLKRLVASQKPLQPETLPYRKELITYLKDQKKSGRKIVLATASHISVAKRIGNHLGLFDQIIATESINLKGNNKLEAIRNEVGDNFVYVGDSTADLPIWESSQAAVLVNTKTSISRHVKQKIPIEAEFSQETINLKKWIKQLRVHQWLKNLLIFVPMLTAFSFLEPANLVNSISAFISFSLIASATYIFNDISDLDNDRVHLTKKNRPLAKADIPIVSAITAAIFCLLFGLAIGSFISIAYLMMLLIYIIVTVSYSLVLKKYVLLDVIALSLLYTLRILSGSVSINITTSNWLLFFSVFIFFSLALIKRCTELINLKKSGESIVSGRDYRVSDLNLMFLLGVSAGISSVVIFGLYISSPETIRYYKTPELLWLVAIGLIFWLSRLWLKTSREEMYEDPVVYAIKDRGSRMIVFMITVLTIVSFYADIGIPG